MKWFEVLGLVIVVVVLLGLIGGIALAAIPFVFLYYLFSAILGIFKRRAIQAVEEPPERDKPFSFAQAILEQISKDDNSDNKGI